MIKSRYLPVIVTVTMCLALLGSIAMVVLAGSAVAATKDYEKKLFNGEIVTIDIQVVEDDWQGLLDNAQAKEYISADLVINGDLFSSVGIRTKGNSSLTQAGGSDNNRYSLQLNPNKYVKGQSFYGLDTMCINNMMSDATYMKDAIAYDIMDYLDVPSPLTNYASVTVNGEDYGLFLLLERYDDSFLDREYNTSAGELYNVKIAMGERSGFEDQEDIAMPEGQENMIPSDNRKDGQIFDGTNMGEGMGGSSGGGGSLIYTDDDPESYYSIFENAVSDKVSDSDKTQMITAIKKLNEGEDLEEYWDVDEILGYLAAHTFVVNLDSYISNMQQNYYLYENNGVISVLPWDYNLAFGGFQSGDAGSAVNFPIDTPVSGVEMEERPLVSQLLAVEEYLEKYHEYLNEIVEGYVNSGLFAESVARIDMQICEYVKTDATAYYTYEEYEAAVDSLVMFVELRAESVAGQLDGSVPSTTAAQSENAGMLIDTGDLDLSAMGSMGGAGERSSGSDQGRGNMSRSNRNSSGESSEEQETSAVGDASANDESVPTQGPAGAPTAGDIGMSFDNGDSQVAGENFSGFTSPTRIGSDTAASTAAGPLTMEDWAMYGIIFVVLLGVMKFMACYRRRRWY